MKFSFLCPNVFSTCTDDFLGYSVMKIVECFFFLRKKILNPQIPFDARNGAIFAIEKK